MVPEFGAAPQHEIFAPDRRLRKYIDARRRQRHRARPAIERFPTVRADRVHACLPLERDTDGRQVRGSGCSVSLPAAKETGWPPRGPVLFEGPAFTMRQPFLIDYLRERYDVQLSVPSEAQCDLVHRVIYDELCAGIVSDASRRAYVEVIDSLAQRGAQAIVLGCTEIGLLISQEDSPLPVLDTTHLHALAALEFALSGG